MSQDPAIVQDLQPCPFCGWHMQGDPRDIIYPTGTYAHWIDPADHSIGLHFNRERQGFAHEVYHVGCTENMGGCGASVTGFGRDGAIATWNRRARTAVDPATVQDLPEPFGWLHDLNGNDPLTFVKGAKLPRPLELVCSTLPVYSHYELRTAVEAAISKERAECAQACKDEMVDAAATGEESDIAYNAACFDCAAAIRARK